MEDKAADVFRGQIIKNVTYYSQVLEFYSLGQWFSIFSKLRMIWRAFKNRRLDHIPRVSDSVGLEWRLRIFSSNKFPDATDPAGPGNHTLRITALGNEKSKRCDQIYILEKSLLAVWRIAWNGTRLGAVKQESNLIVQVREQGALRKANLILCIQSSLKTLSKNMF